MIKEIEREMQNKAICRAGMSGLVSKMEMHIYTQTMNAFLN